jgi:hypothetical protein
MISAARTIPMSTTSLTELFKRDLHRSGASSAYIGGDFDPLTWQPVERLCHCGARFGGHSGPVGSANQMSPFHVGFWPTLSASSA